MPYKTPKPLRPDGPALASNIGRQLGWEQLVTVIGEKRVHRPGRDQVTTPGRRVRRASDGWL